MEGEVDRLRGYVHTVVMGPPLPSAILEERKSQGIPILLVDQERVWCGGFFMPVTELAALEAARLKLVEAVDSVGVDALAGVTVAEDEEDVIGCLGPVGEFASDECETVCRDAVVPECIDEYVVHEHQHYVEVVSPLHAGKSVCGSPAVSSSEVVGEMSSEVVGGAGQRADERYEKDADDPGVSFARSPWDSVAVVLAPVDAMTQDSALVGDGWVRSWGERDKGRGRSVVTVGSFLGGFPAVERLPKGLEFGRAWAEGLVVFPHEPDPSDVRKAVECEKEKSVGAGRDGVGTGFEDTCQWYLGLRGESVNLAFKTSGGEFVASEFSGGRVVTRQSGVETGRLTRTSFDLLSGFLSECDRRNREGEAYRVPWWFGGDSPVGKSSRRMNVDMYRAGMEMYEKR